MRRLDMIGRRQAAPAELESRFNLSGLSQMLAGYGGFGPERPVTTWDNDTTESMGTSFEGYVQAGYKNNGVVFAVILARMMLFTEARFQWQDMTGWTPGKLFGNRDLELLESPWTNGTTGDLLAHMEQDVSLAGNAYVARRTIGGRTQLRRLRPDHVEIVVGSPSGDYDDIDADVVGYRYWPHGIRAGTSVVLQAADVMHYAPIPDPTAKFRGMSWLTPIVEEVRADSAATSHKGSFFDNAATPNMVVSIPSVMDKPDFMELVRTHEENHMGAGNAYKTMWLLGGAEPTMVGANMQQMDFAATQGAGETRIAAAGGVPPVIVGLSEGLAQATYSNYGQARRKFADGWARPQWRTAAAALQTLLPVPAQSRLWYDDTDISFLQEDQKDDAEIQGRNAQTIRTLVDAGYEPGSVTDAVTAGDMSKLVHSGLYSVQLQAPGSENGSQSSATLAP